MKNTSFEPDHVAKRGRNHGTSSDIQLGAWSSQHDRWWSFRYYQASGRRRTKTYSVQLNNNSLLRDLGAFFSLESLRMLTEKLVLF